jgi:antitoxin component of MazEF toxin-antitoxin module
MEVRKIFRAGNSCVIALPGYMLESLEMREGSHVSLELSRETQEIIMKPIIVKQKSLAIEFVRLVDKLMLEYDYMLRRLA